MTKLIVRGGQCCVSTLTVVALVDGVGEGVGGGVGQGAGEARILDIGAVLAHGAGGAGDHEHTANAKPDAFVKQKNSVTASTDFEGWADTESTMIDLG